MRGEGPGNRKLADSMLKQVLEGNPAFFGVWTVWEPNAFDGQDHEFINQRGTDATGRYVPYWNRGSGQVGVEALNNYEVPGEGDYYLLARNSGEETLLEPYEYEINGHKTLFTSMVVPIRHNGVVVGVAGVDILLSDLQERISQIKPFGTGYASLISNQGNYIAEREPENIGKAIPSGNAWDKIKPAIKAGQPYEDNFQDASLQTEVLRIYQPISIAQSKTPWSLGISVPEKTILEGVHNLRNTAIIIGLLSVILVSLV